MGGVGFDSMPRGLGLCAVLNGTPSYCIPPVLLSHLPPVGLRCLEALLLVRCQVVGSTPPPHLKHLWLADCAATNRPLAQVGTDEGR